MEILTIDEVIEHCERQTKQLNKIADERNAEFLNSNFGKIFMEHKLTAEWLKELKEYKQMEEQGLLIRLPFAVGDIVYWAEKEVYTFEVIEIRIGKYETDVRFAYRGTEENKRYWQIIKTIDGIRGKVFLTKEEAEAALERMSENA